MPQFCIISNCFRLPLLILLPSRSPSSSPLVSWSPPPPGFLTLNFDRACKGNLGSTSFGGIFCDNYNQPMFLFADSIRRSSNNEIEFEALKTDLVIAPSQGFSRLIVEGDSQMIISRVKKLINRASLKKCHNQRF